MSDSKVMNWDALAPGFDPEEIAGAWGPVDPELVCLVVERQNRPIAAVVNFGLHPAVRAGDNWLYSADYPGYLAEGLSRTMDEPFTGLFLNGCCGDVNHVDYRDRLQGRGYQMAQRVGYLLAATAHEAINRRTPLRGDRVSVSREKVTLKRLRISPEEHQWCERVLEEARSRPPQGQVDGVPDVYYAGLRLGMWETQDQPDEAEVMVIRVGDAALVGLPGQTGQLSAAALSHTVKIRSNSGPSAKSFQLFERNP